MATREAPAAPNRAAPDEDGAEPDRAQPDLRLVPCALSAWLTAWCATAQLWWPIVVACGLALILLVVAHWRRSPVALAAALVLLVLGGVSWVRSEALHSSAVAEAAKAGAVVTAEVSVTADPHRVTGGIRPRVVIGADVALLDPDGARIVTSVPAVLSAEPGSAIASAVVGSRWRVQGSASEPDPGAEVAAFLRVGDARQVAGPDPPWLVVERVRQGLREAVAARPPEPRALVPALVVGDVSAMTPEMTDDFRIAGLTHLTAVSGANLTLLLAFLMILARWIGIRGRGLTAVSLAAVVVFVALCRTEPSVLRATAMGVVALAAVGRGGAGGRAIRHLCVAMLALLVVDPWLARSVGFALSVLATGGIIWWGGTWAERLSWLPRVIAEAVAVPLAAQVATQPVVAALSGQVSIVGLLANAVAGPLVGPATVAGFAAAGLSLVHPWPAAAAGWLASWPAQAIIAVGHAAAMLPGAALRLPVSELTIGWLVVLSLLVAWWMPRLLGRRWACLALAVAMVVVLFRAPAQPGWPPSGWVVAACDVGQGDAMVVQVGPGEAIVVDTGPDPAPFDRCLSQLGVSHVRLAILTHHHADHVGGLSALWRGRTVDQVVTTPVAVPAEAAAATARTLASQGIPERTVLAGEVLVVGPARWETLWPTPSAAQRLSAAGGTTTSDAESSVENDASLVGRLTIGGVSILFTGDLEPTGQVELLSSGANLRADVLKVPHHGSARQDEQFLAAVGARWALVSAGEHNSYGHPAPRTVRALEADGMVVLRTDRSGGIALAVVTDGAQRRWNVRSQR